MSSSNRSVATDVHPLMKDIIEIIEREPRINECTKDPFKAACARGEGNKYYKNKEFDEALHYYNKSVSLAPTNSEELALAFANRSAVLMSRRRFELCLLDVNRALQGPLPSEESREILLKRREKILRRWWRVRNQEAAENDGTKKHPAHKRFSYPVTDIDQTDLPSDDSPIYNDPIWNTKFDNPLLPNVSRKIKIEHNAEFGRHIVAAEDIDPGEVISIESWFTTLPDETNGIKNCYCCYCMLWCEALIPCPTCTEEMYCNDHCRQLAYDSYHRTECKIMNEVSKNATIIEKMFVLSSLRTFLVGTKQGAELTNLMNDPKVRDILEGNSNIVGESRTMNDYYSMLDLPWKNTIPLWNAKGNRKICGNNDDKANEYIRPGNHVENNNATANEQKPTRSGGNKEGTVNEMEFKGSGDGVDGPTDTAETKGMSASENVNDAEGKPKVNDDVADMVVQCTTGGSVGRTDNRADERAGKGRGDSNDDTIKKGECNERQSRGQDYNNNFTAEKKESKSISSDDECQSANNGNGIAGKISLKIVQIIFRALRQIHLFCESGKCKREVHEVLLTDKEIFASVLLTQHVLAIMQYPFESICAIHTRSIGIISRGLGGIINFMNHSCDPNVACITNKRQILFYSSRPIKAGEQIFRAYSNQNCNLNSLEDRATTLGLYLFQCRCVACRNNWPTIISMVNAKTPEKYKTIDERKITEIMEMIEWQTKTLPRCIETTEMEFRKSLEYNKTIRQFVEEPSLTIYVCEFHIYKVMMEKGSTYTP